MDGTYRGVVQEGKVVFQGQSPPLTDGTEVLVTPVVSAATPSPDVPREWVEEVEQLMAAYQRELPPQLIEEIRNEPAGEQADELGRLIAEHKRRLSPQSSEQTGNESPEEWERLIASWKRPLPPELIERLRNESTPEEARAQFERLQAEGGQQLHEFIGKLERSAILARLEAIKARES
jgi:hypothetical protein